MTTPFEQKIHDELKEFCRGIEVSPGLAKIWARIQAEKEGEENDETT